MLVLLFLTQKISFSTILLLYIIVGSIYLLYLIIDLYLFILLIRDKMTIPYYLPDFIRNWLLKKEEIAKWEAHVVRSFVDLDVRNIISHIIGLSLLIIFYIYI